MKRTAARYGLALALVALACESESTGITGQLDEEPRSAPVARTPPVPSDRFAAASRHDAENATEVLAQALTSMDDYQAKRAAKALLAHHGCPAVRGPVREGLLRQLQSFPTPQGIILTGCLRQDEEALRRLRVLEPPDTPLARFGSPFSDWETLRTFALAEAGDQDAKNELLRRLRAKELNLTKALLDRGVFPYVQDRELLLALSESILDSRKLRPEGEEAPDFPNPEISVVAAYAYAFRFGIPTPGAKGRPRPFTVTEKRSVYERVREILSGLEIGERLPQKRLPGRNLP